MKRDVLFAGEATAPSHFSFDEAVADIFDDMIVRSVPFYTEQQALVVQLAQRFFIPGRQVYDLGCSTATTLLALGRALPLTPQFIGYDNSFPMLEKARQKIEAARLTNRIELRHADLNADPESLNLQDAGGLLLCWTLQFVHPARREQLLRRLNQALPAGGALIVAEKVLPDDARLNEPWRILYEDYKRRQGYSELEIARKREALRGVLAPLRLGENLALFHRSGFTRAEIVFQDLHFAAFLCRKGNEPP